MNDDTRLDPSSATAARAQLVVDVAAALEARFPLQTLAHVTRVVQDAHDLIVGDGVRIRAYLSNLIEHRARTLLRAEEDGPRRPALAAVAV